MAAFLEHVALISDVDSYDRDADAISMMTVHASKGLEFPVVFITGLEEGIFPIPCPYWMRLRLRKSGAWPMWA